MRDKIERLTAQQRIDFDAKSRIRKGLQRKKGESLEFVFDRGDLSIAGWVCTIFWKKNKADSVVGTRVITPTDGEWSGFLTTTETASLPTGLYYLTAKLTNATTLEEEQHERRFNIVDEWA